jgi:hypothetical protein
MCAPEPLFQRDFSLSSVSVPLIVSVQFIY